MNDKFTDITNTDDENIARKLSQVAEKTNVNPQFSTELEEKLRNTYPSKTSWFVLLFNQISPTLRWVALMFLLGLVLSLSIKSLTPIPQPSTNATPNRFVCPVTQANGSLPPGTQVSDNSDVSNYGNDKLWTILRPGGKIHLLPENQRSDGSFEINWSWWLSAEAGQLTIEGHRLDVKAEPLRVVMLDPFNNVRSVTLIFPTTGCWEITAKAGEASLTFITEVVFGDVTATPGPITPVVTPIPEDTGYDWRGAKLYLEQPLPESPHQAYVYLLKKDEPATEEQARALAERFGIQGEIYSASFLMYGHTDFVFTDGKQLLEVYSSRYFSYVADIAKSRRYPYGIQPSDHAEATIHEFLKARGLDFTFRLSASDFPGNYIVKPLALDLISMQYESFTQPVMRVALDENGEILSVDASLVDYETAPVGEYGIISAQEALQILLNDNIQKGKMEYVHSPNDMPMEWYRSYPDNQPVTVYGYLTSYPALDPTKPALLFIDGVAVTGNINGLESLENSSFIKATGQYVVENGIRKFNVQSWDRKVQETYLSGTLSRQGDQIIITRDDGTGKQYPLIDPPADIPLDTKVPDSQLSVSGVLVDGKMFWTYIQFFDNYSGGGGGGGNGLGFYKLNLSGTPVPYPSPSAQPNINHGNVEYIVKEGDTVAAIAEAYGITPEKIFEANSWLDGGVLTPGKTLIIPNTQRATNNQPIGSYTIKEGDTLTMIAQNYGTTVDQIMQLNGLTDTNIFAGQTLYIPIVKGFEPRMEDLRGFLSISIHNKTDGTTTKEYNLEVGQENGSQIYSLDGSNLSELDKYNALPIIVFGTLSSQTGALVVDSYNIPFPDLQFRIVKGTQRAEQLDEQTVVIFTTENGESYVEVIASTSQLSNSFTGHQGDLIEQEILVVPDETFGGMPVAHIYQSSIIQENGPEMEPRANQIYVFNELDEPSLSPDYRPPNLNINQVELAYYVSNPYYQVNDTNYSQRPPYIQPVWHFHGRYEDGSEFDVLIQALKQEFLLPELSPGLSPG